mmetsp:Transcript_37239/g.97097  ORF Transcript_37239/g.97097 Transcript_37239/m.97097 type:complete len:216 (-) Transcript_37239:49-696(-)
MSWTVSPVAGSSVGRPFSTSHRWPVAKLSVNSWASISAAAYAPRRTGVNLQSGSPPGMSTRSPRSRRPRGSSSTQCHGCAGKYQSVSKSAARTRKGRCRFGMSLCSTAQPGGVFKKRNVDTFTWCRISGYTCGEILWGNAWLGSHTHALSWSWGFTPERTRRSSPSTSVTSAISHPSSPYTNSMSRGLMTSHPKACAALIGGHCSGHPEPVGREE